MSSFVGLEGTAEMLDTPVASETDNADTALNMCRFYKEQSNSFAADTFASPKCEMVFKSRSNTSTCKMRIFHLSEKLSPEKKIVFLVFIVSAL